MSLQRTQIGNSMKSEKQYMKKVKQKERNHKKEPNRTQFFIRILFLA